MDKYMVNAALRGDLQHVVDQMGRIIEGIEADCIDWNEIEAAKGMISAVYSFYKFKEKV